MVKFLSSSPQTFPAACDASASGQAVIITFLGEDHLSTQPTKIETGWDALQQLVEDCGVETGINDLAHQHGHDLYGTPKQA